MENNIAPPFDFNFGNTETIELESALTQHLNNSEEIEKVEEPKKEIKSALPKPAKKDEETEIETISDKELEEQLLNSAFEEKEEPEEKEETTEETVSNAEQLAKDFYKLGLLTGEEQEIKTDEQLVEALEIESDKKADNKISAFIESKGEKVVNWFKACVMQGIDPEEYFSISKNIESVASVDMEDVNVQRSLVRRSLIERSGFTQEKAEKYIKVLEADGDLDKEAVAAQEMFLASEEKLLLQKAKEKEAEQKFKLHEATQYKTNVHTKLSEVLKTKDIAGLPVTDKIAQNTLDYMTEKNWRIGTDEISDFDKFLLELKKPENIETALKVALLAQNNFDFSKIKQKAVSEQTDKLFTKFAKKETEVKRELGFTDKFKIDI